MKPDLPREGGRGRPSRGGLSVVYIFVGLLSCAALVISKFYKLADAVRFLGRVRFYFAESPHWTDFRAVSNTAAARAVILIPLIGYWIIFNDYIVECTRLSRFLYRDGTEPANYFPLRLFFVYFGLCFVAVASTLYQWRCSPEIKLYPTATEYVGSIFPHISGIEEVRVEQALREGDDISRTLLAQIGESIG